MSFIIKDLSYIHTDKEILFSHLHLSINSGEIENWGIETNVAVSYTHLTLPTT